MQIKLIETVRRKFTARTFFLEFYDSRVFDLCIHNMYYISFICSIMIIGWKIRWTNQQSRSIKQSFTGYFSIREYFQQYRTEWNKNYTAMKILQRNLLERKNKGKMFGTVQPRNTPNVTVCVWCSSVQRFRNFFPRQSVWDTHSRAIRRRSNFCRKLLNATAAFGVFDDRKKITQERVLGRKLPCKIAREKIERTNSGRKNALRPRNENMRRVNAENEPFPRGAFES